MSPSLARRYLGALRVAADPANPDRLSLSSHGIRELINELPEVLDVPLVVYQDKRTNRVQALVDRWAPLMESSPLRHEGRWEGTIDNNMRRGLERVDQLVDSALHNTRRRKEQTTRFLAELDPSGMAMPAPLSEQATRAWTEIRDYFVKIAHHASKTTEAEFATRLLTLEVFLLERLRPTTFADFEEIDRLLKEED